MSPRVTPAYSGKMKRSHRLSFGSNDGTRPLSPKKAKQDRASRAMLKEEERQQPQQGEDNKKDQSEQHQEDHHSYHVSRRQDEQQGSNLGDNKQHGLDHDQGHIERNGGSNAKSRDDYGGLGVGVGEHAGMPGGNAPDDDDDDQMPSLEVEQARLLQQMAIDMGRRTETAEFYKNDAEERHGNISADKPDGKCDVVSAAARGDDANEALSRMRTTETSHARNAALQSSEASMLQSSEAVQHNASPQSQLIKPTYREGVQPTNNESRGNKKEHPPHQDNKSAPKRKINHTNSKAQNTRQSKLDELHQDKLQDLIEKGNKLSEAASRMSGVGSLMPHNLYGFQNKSHLHQHEELSSQMRRQENQLIQQQQLRQKQLALQQQQQQLQQHLEQKEREQKLRMLKDQIRQQEELYLKQQEQYQKLVGGNTSDNNLLPGASKDSEMSSMEQRLRFGNLNNANQSKPLADTMKGSRPNSNLKSSNDANDSSATSGPLSFHGLRSSRARDNSDVNEQSEVNRFYEQILQNLVKGASTIHGSRLSEERVEEWTNLFFERPNANDHNSTETWLLKVMDVSDPAVPVPTNDLSSFDEQRNKFENLDTTQYAERSGKESSLRKRKGEALKGNQEKHKSMQGNSMSNYAHMNGLFGMGGGIGNENALSSDYLREDSGYGGMNNTFMSSVLGQGFDAINGGMPMNKRKEMMPNDNLNLLMNMNRNAVGTGSEGMHNLNSGFSPDNFMKMNSSLSSADAAAMMNMNLGMNMSRNAEAMMKRNNLNGFNTDAFMGSNSNFTMEDMMRMNNGWNSFDRGSKAAENMLKMNGFDSGGMTGNFSSFGVN